MKAVFLKDIKEKDKVDSTFLVTKKETAVSKAGKPYLALRLADSSGEAEARVWDGAESLADAFQKDDIASVKGAAVLYQGKIQINVSDIKKVPDKDLSMRDYLPSSKRPAAEMMVELEAVIAGIKNRHVRALLDGVFADKKRRELFMLAPAAKGMHHPYLGGLLEHVLSLCRTAKLVSGHYKSVDEDFLIAGAILHDVGKIHELSYSRAFDYTDEGKLIGHITIGISIIDSVASVMDGFPGEVLTRIKHMILSHHGHLEFGSPKLPMTLEAVVLYYLDDLDAKVNEMESLLEKNEGIGNWTAKSRMFERTMYRAGSNAKEAEKEDERRTASGKKEELKLFK